MVAISLKFEAVCLYDYVWQKKIGITRDAALQYHLLSIITVAYVHIIVALKSSICMSSFDKMTTFDIPISIKYCHAKYFVVSISPTLLENWGVEVGGINIA